MQIYIDVPEQDLLAIEVEPSDDIANVKDKIEDKTSIPVANQTLYFNSTLMEDDHALADYNIQKGSTLQLAISGGSSAPSWVLAGDTWDDATKTLTVNSNPGTEAYYQNTEIKHLIISDGVTTIGESAFDECTALLSVVIGNDVTNIEANAFDECGAMTSLTIGNKVQTIGESAFGSCESLTSVIIPNSVTSIGNSAFNTCDQMSSLTIGSSVQTIGESAFKNCSMLTDVTIPASVESIGAWFFRNCENLATITCEATTPPTLGNNAFFDCDKLEHIYVPAASVATYKAADNWATKEAIISAIPTNQLYMEVDGTAGTLKWGLAGSNPVYDGNAIQYSDRKFITTLTIDESCQNHTLTSFYNLFYVFKALTTINGIENLATANVESMRYMFYDCQALTSLDLSSFNTAKVTDMKGMFNGCSNLTTIYVGDDWNTSAVTDGYAMFYGCTNLPNYDSEATGVDKAYVGAGGYLSANLTPADVIALISAIGEVEYTAESKAKIDAARAAYDGLSAADKALVTNYSTLTDAETAYADAKTAADQAAADAVKDLIAALPNPVQESDLKLSVYTKVQDARTAFDALTAEQKALVTNIAILEAAEAAFAAIPGGAPTVVVIYKSEFTSTGVTKEGVNLALSNGSMTADDMLAMDGSFEFSTSLGKFTNITIETDVNIMNISEGASTSAGWPTGTNLGTSAAWTGNSESVLIDCMVAGNAITITCTVAPASVIADAIAARDLINAIPNPVTFVGICGNAIEAARAAVTALGEAASLIDDADIQKLTDAEAAWTALIPDPVVLPTVKYAVCNVPDGWAVTANGDAVLPINGRYHIADGQTVVLTPPASKDAESITSAEEAGLLGAGTAEDPYLIYTVANWNAVAAKVNDGTQAAPNCRQMANLDGITTVMGNSESKPFKGIYDGNGFVFTNINLSITSGENPLGLFGCVNDASAVVKNVVVAGGTVSSTFRNVGAIVGQLNGGTVQYCANYATVSSSYDGSVRIGGIVGWMRSAGGDNNRVDHCINYGNVSGKGYVGGITGSCGAGYVSYCQNYGSISSSGTDDATRGSAGGIIGWYNPTDDTKVTYNHNGGNITEATNGHDPSRYIIANTPNISLPGSNSYLSSSIVTVGATSYTGAELATHDTKAQALAINPEGITISGITYAYGVAAPVAPAPGTNPGTDPAKQPNRSWQFTMPSHNIGLAVTIIPKLPGAFSINANGDKVQFAKGNLQATTTDLGANWTWDFAPNQWSLIGDAVANNAINGNKKVSANGTVDLFGWSTAATYYGINNSWKNDDYAGDFVDWGALMGTEWRTLSKEEWYYIVYTRTEAYKKRSHAMVNGVNGYIFLPDEWELPSGLSFTPNAGNYTTNTYDGADWIAMENAGAVFLPAAGVREGSDIYQVNLYGWYWASTPHDEDGGKAYYLWFDASSNGVTEYNRWKSKSVRLVTVAPKTPADVIALINAIGTVDSTPESKAKIDAAREAYETLSDADKALVTNYSTLTAAEQAYADAKQAADQAVADPVIAKINNIPTPVELKLATRDSIESARAAYDALNAAQQALVTNYDDLVAAEAALAGLNPGGGAPLPEGALTGAFSINADGDKIAFSKGNLQATYGGSDWTWAFAAHQYDVIGNAVANTAITGSGTVSANGTVDLFGWSTSATYYGINNTNVSGKHPGDFIDWGETIAEGWRTLTRDEWGYLFETRTDAASKYGHATVAGIHGIIILPDSYKGTAINADHSDWSDNTISAEDWAAYEANGVAFLPAAGSRLVTSVNSVGKYAFYWTSTTYGEKWAYRVRFVPELSPDYGDRVAGQSVRLVTAHTGGATPLDSAQAVKDLIDAIPVPVTLDAACVNAVQAARDAYNALSDATKGALDDATVQKLNQAITDYTALIQAEADAVKAKIANIPQPVTLKLATRDSIESARAAYDALTADQKLLVSNYDVLTAAEAALAALNPGGGMPANALNGKFTINAGGDQISFAKGNLQATTTDLGAHWTWGFAANQWDYLSIAVANNKIDGNGTVSENGTVDLFGWSTAATYYGINNSYNAVDYIGDFVDWGPNMGAGWRTLTKDEWNYLIENNTKGRATVNDKSGYIFLPNDWSGLAFTPDPDNFTTNVYSGDDWTAMENAGAVFLPSGPARNGTNALIAMDAKYSSSTSLNNDTSYVFTIYYGQSQSACTGTNRAYGCMVRLVTGGGGATPLDSAQVVKDLIEAIPAEITLDAACVKAIEDAHAAYDALSDNAKGALDDATVQKLTNAEDALEALNKAEADKVIAKINAIPTPVELKLATRDSIQNARAAYDALTAAQQALVTNYQKLLDAEAALAELNKGGSASVDIVWDKNTGIANVDPNTTSPAYKGITITTGNGNRFYQTTTTNPAMLRFFFTGGVGSYAFAQEDGSHFTKVVLISSVAMSEWLINPSRIGTDWAVSDEDKKATWTGDADTVKIWDGVGATSWVDVDSIVFTVSGSATPLDSAQAVKDLIDAIPTPVEYPTSGPAIAAALVAYNQLSDAAKGALDAADVQKMTDAATQYAALDAIAAIEAIPAEIVYDPAVKAAIETAREKYDALIDASKALVEAEVLQKLTNAEEAWAILVAKIEHNVFYIGKDGELKRETVALLNIPDPAPDFNGYEFDQWIVKAGDFLEEGLRIQASYTPIITTNPAAYDTLVYNGTAQTLIAAGVAKEGHIEYRLNDGEWSAELPKADMAAAYVVYYKLVREAHEDYMAGSVNVTIAKAPVAYTAPAAYDTLVYTASDQTLIAAGQTKDGTFQYSLDPTMPESWNTELPKAMAAGTYDVYYRVNGDLNHLDSVAADPVVVTIAKAELTATADNKAIIFGELAPQFTVTYTGWQGQDKDSVLTGDIAFACPYVRGNNVGAYSITPSGVEAANYTVNFVQGSLTVNRKSASSADITAAQLLDEKLVYTNAVNKPTIVVTDTTLQLTEVKDYNLTFIGRGETQYAEAATAPVHVGDYTAIVDFVGNYKDTLTVDFAIAKAPLTITAENKEIIFGENAPEFTVAYTGFLGTDTATVLTGSQAYACEYVRGDIVGDYTIIPSGVDAHDYAITFTNGTLTVNRKSATSVDIKASQLDGEKLIYTNAVNRPTIVVMDTTLQLTESKDYTLSFFGTLADNTPYAESATAPTHVGNYTAIVAFEGNYKDSLTVDFLINQAPLTITANDTAMIYGDEAPAFSVSYNGFLGDDEPSVLLGTQAYTCVYAPGSPIGTYAITPKDVTAYDYAITFVDGKLTVNKAVVSVSGAQVHEAKFADGHAGAEVTDKGTLNGVKLNDPLNHVTTASFSSAEVSEHLTITLFYELTGDAALINNYDLQPTSEIFTTEGVIIEPFHPDTTQTPEADEEQNKVQEGIEVYAYGYCEGDNVGLKYHLNSGNPDQYKIDFADSRFTDVDWTNLDITGPDGVIYIDVPVDVPTGDYNMTVYFRDSRFTWLESQALNVTFHVNLPETYVKPLFDNTIVLVDTCDCFTDIQWYYRATSSEPWAPIPGATGHYYRPENGTKLTGEYFVSAKMNGVPTYTCGQEDMETLYGADSNQQQAQVVAYPNPVESNTNVTIKNSTLWNHNLRVVNLMGIEVLNTTFEGDETIVNMSGFVSGNYMISVDGISVKVMKK